MTAVQSMNEIRNEAMLTIERGVINAKLEAMVGDIDRLNEILTDMLHAARKMQQIDRAELRYLDAQNSLLSKNLRESQAEARRLAMEAHPTNHGYGY